MNNILTFEDYKKMNIRQVESVIYRQFIEEDIEREDKINDEVNEGLIRNFINKQSSKFIQAALGDEIEKGKELERSIKEALDGLNKGFEEIENNIDANAKVKPNNEAIEKVKEAIKAVQSQAFDTLTMIGSEGEIDFAGFMGSASVAAAANFGILFSPIRSIFMTRKAYKYFLGIIKQTIRRNLLVIQLNFDQFENLILQKSFESDEDSEFFTKIETLNSVMDSLTRELCDGKNKFLKDSKNKELKDRIEIIRKNTSDAFKQHKETSRSNPFRSLWEDQHNNTYTRTLEQIKQYINDDSQKELDALKNSITKMAGSDVDLVPYGELLISAAEEYAIHTNHGINNNFIKMSSVFNLENQKKLIELIVKGEEDAKRKREEDARALEEAAKKASEEIERDAEEGEEICEKELANSSETYTLEEFEKMFGDDIKSIMAYFMTTEKGKITYKKISERNPTYQYYIGDPKSLQSLLSSINSLNIVEVSDMDDFYKNIINKEQTLYYMMAEQSIKNAVKSINDSKEEYFGFKGIKKDKDNILSVKDSKKDKILNTIVGNETILIDKGEKIEAPKKRYFLTIDGDGDGLFKLIHREFKTKIFKSDKDTGANSYVDKISLKNKITLMEVIHKYLGIGKSISEKFAEYLVRLDAHMLLEKKEPWFVAENNDDLFNSGCFKIKGARKIVNKHAFVEISKDDYDTVNSFLSEYHKLYDNDFWKEELEENNPKEQPKANAKKKTTKK